MFCQFAIHPLLISYQNDFDAMIASGHDGSLYCRVRCLLAPHGINGYLHISTCDPLGKAGSNSAPNQCVRQRIDDSMDLGFFFFKNLFPLVGPTMRTDAMGEFWFITLRA